MKGVRLYINILMTLCVIYAAAPLAASEQVPAPPQRQPIALKGGTVHTVSGADIANGTVLFERGVITAVGAAADLPPGTKVIDVTGKHVYPGLIECSSQLGLVEIDAVNATVDFREIGDVNPNVQAQKAINPDSERFPITRSNGVALAVSVPVGGLIAGQASLLMLDGWTWEDMTLKTSVGMIVNWPPMTLPAFADKDAQEKRLKQIDDQIGAIKKAFEEARAYMTARTTAGRFHKTDVRWEAMLPVLNRTLPVWVHANTLREIEAAADWAKEENVRMVLVGGADAWRCADMLKENGIPVIVTPVKRLPLRRDSDYDEPFTLAGKLYRAGVPFAIAGGSGSGNERNLPYHAAMAAAYGLPEEAALKAVTIFAAEILGVSEKIGSIEPGKDATIIVTDGTPLDIKTHTEMMFIQGRNIDLGNRQIELYKKYREKYRQLSE